jgi:hypothetical protein
MEIGGTSEAASQKRCIACQSLIEVEASLCHICGSYQTGWKNSLKYWGGVAGFIAIIVSLITYLWTAFPKAFFKDNVSILEFDNTRITVSNEGYGKVFVSAIFIESTSLLIDISMLRQISEKVDVGEISRFPVKAYKSVQGPLKTVSYSDEEWKKVLKISQKIEDQCFLPVFYLKQGEALKRLKSEAQNLRTFPAKGELKYYSNRRRKYYPKSVELEGVILRRDSPDCINLLR